MKETRISTFLITNITGIGLKKIGKKIKIKFFVFVALLFLNHISSYLLFYFSIYCSKTWLNIQHNLAHVLSFFAKSVSAALVLTVCLAIDRVKARGRNVAVSFPG